MNKLCTLLSVLKLLHRHRAGIFTQPFLKIQPFSDQMLVNLLRRFRCDHACAARSVIRHLASTIRLNIRRELFNRLFQSPFNYCNRSHVITQLVPSCLLRSRLADLVNCKRSSSHCNLLIRETEDTYRENCRTGIIISLRVYRFLKEISTQLRHLELNFFLHDSLIYFFSERASKRLNQGV